MAICNVLNCEKQTAGRVKTSTDDLRQPFMEAAMCAEHIAAFNAGDRWAYGDNSVILMGTDLAPSLINFTVQGSGVPGATIVLEAGRLGEKPHSLTAWIAPDQIKSFVHALELCAGEE